MKIDMNVNGIKWTATNMENKKLRVMMTVDQRGATVSIGDKEDGTMFSVPFDAILKELKKGGRL